MSIQRSKWDDHGVKIWGVIEDAGWPMGLSDVRKIVEAELSHTDLVEAAVYFTEELRVWAVLESRMEFEDLNHAMNFICEGTLLESLGAFADSDLRTEFESAFQKIATDNIDSFNREMLTASFSPFRQYWPFRLIQ